MVTVAKLLCKQGTRFLHPSVSSKVTVVYRMLSGQAPTSEDDGVKVKFHLLSHSTTEDSFSLIRIFYYISNWSVQIIYPLPLQQCSNQSCYLCISWCLYANSKRKLNIPGQGKANKQGALTEL